MGQGGAHGDHNGAEERVPRPDDDAGRDHAGVAFPHGRGARPQRRRGTVMTKIRALIVEDEPLARRTLREILAGVPWLECVGEAETGTRAVEMIDALTPDLVLLDIEMPELNGLQVLDRIAHEPAVIFTTAYDRYAVSAFELEALDYLLKPFGRERCLAALERARRALPANGAPADQSAPPLVERARHVLGESG